VAETNLFKWRHYESDIILLCVRWRLRYALSYRDLEEMMNERGLSLDHTTIYRSRSGICSGTGEKNSSSLETDQRRLCCKNRRLVFDDGRLTRFLFSSGGLP